MADRRRQQFVHGLVAWMLGTVVTLSVVGMLSIELFFIVSLVGFIGLVELTAPVNVSPRWRAKLKWFVLLGMVGFVLFMVKRILDFLPSGVF